MSSNQRIARITGVLLLLSMVAGIYNNLFLLGPVTSGSNFLTKAGANSNQVTLSILLSLVLGIVTIAISIILYEPFKSYSKSLALGFVAFSVIKFTFSAIDKAAIISLLSVSDEFLKVNTADAGFYQSLGNIFFNIREFTHLTDILFGFVASSLLFYLIYQNKLIPLIITLTGILACVLGASEMILNLFGFNHKWHMLMLLPMALNQIILSVWLMLKGFYSKDLRGFEEVQNL